MIRARPAYKTTVSEGILACLVCIVWILATIVNAVILIKSITMRKRKDIIVLNAWFFWLSFLDLLQSIVCFAVFLVKMQYGVLVFDYDYAICKFYGPFVMVGWKFTVLALVALTKARFSNIFRKDSKEPRKGMIFTIILGVFALISLIFSLVRCYFLELTRLKPYLTSYNSFMENA